MMVTPGELRIKLTSMKIKANTYPSKKKIKIK